MQTMTTALQYDGSFEGLLCACAAALDARAEAPEIYADRPGSGGWLFGSEIVETEPKKAAALLAAVERHGGGGTVRHLVHAFLADDPEMERAAAGVVRLTIAKKQNVLGWRQQPLVAALQGMAHRVAYETHRLTGLLRFMELRDGTLYAPCRPDHNVILPLAVHFKARFPGEKWVIHDRGRESAVLWDGLRLEQIAEVPPGIESELSADERAFQRLWHLFTRTIAVRERSNPRLQRQLMPRRYWPHLTEMRAVPPSPSC